MRRWCRRVTQTGARCHLGWASQAQPQPSCEVVAHRLEGYKFIKPLLYNSKTCESGNYHGLKVNIEDAIKNYQQSGRIDNASVYLKLLNNH